VPSFGTGDVTMNMPVAETSAVKPLWLKVFSPTFTRNRRAYLR
jgi:hypothetical protein